MMSDQDTEHLRSMLPKEFGKAETNTQEAVEVRLKAALRSEYLESQKSVAKQTSTSNSSDENSSSSEDEEDPLYPITHEFSIPAHTKSVSSISLDASGTNMFTSSYDTNLNYFSFPGMDPTEKAPYKSLSPLESHQLHSVSYNSRSLLVIPRFSRPLLLDPISGAEIAEFKVGDMYIVDQNKTKGHTAELTSGCWHSTNLNTFITSSRDSTVRIWDSLNPRSQKSVIMVRDSKGKKCIVESVSHSKSKDSVLLGTDTGTLQIWDLNGPLRRPAISLSTAHSDRLINITMSPQDNIFATRSFDQILNLWDIRNMKSPLLSKKSTSQVNLETTFEDSNLSFSPSGTTLLFGSSSQELHFLDTSDLSVTQTIHVGPVNSTITCTEWHPRLNQIFVGTSTGQISILFSPERGSKNGAIMTVSKPAKRKAGLDGSVSISAVGLEEDIQRQNEKLHPGKRKLAKEGNDYSVFKDPNAGKGHSMWGQPDEKHVRENIPLSNLVKEDPRDELLKWESEVKKRKMN